MKRVVISLVVMVLLAGAAVFGAPALRYLRQAVHDGRYADEVAQITQKAAAHRDQLRSDPASPVAGNPAGDVTIVEFFDYQCPYCKASSTTLAQLLAEDNGIRLVLKEFPVLGDDSILASRAAVASIAQGKYWAFHQALLAHRGGFDVPTLKNIARSVGMDADRMEADMSVSATDPAIQGNLHLADEIGIQVTPTFIIGDQAYEGATSLEELRALVEKARKG